MKYYVIINKYKMYHNNYGRYRTCTECNQRFIEDEEPETLERFFNPLAPIADIAESVEQGKTARKEAEERTKQTQAVMDTDLTNEFDPSVCPPPITPQPLPVSQMRIQAAASALMSDYSDICPQPQVPPPMERKSMVESLANTMGLTECSATKCSHDDRGGSAGTDLSFKDNFGSITEGSSVIGCSEMLMMEEKIRNITQNISCTLNRQTNTTSVNVYAGNKITLSASGGSTLNIECPQLNFNQSIKVKLVIMSKISTEQKTNISSTMDTTIKDIAKYLETTVSNIPDDRVTGGREFIEKMQDIQSTNYSSDVMDIFNTFDVKQVGSNDIEISATDGSTINIRGAACNFDQNIVLNILAQNIVDTTMDKAFHNVFKNVTLNKREKKIDRNITVPERRDPIRRELPVKPPPPPKTNDGSNAGLIIGIVVTIIILMLLVGVGIYMYKRKQKQMIAAATGLQL